MAARSTRRWLFFSGALALPALYLFRRVLFGGETFVERDMTAFYRASRMVFVRLWAECSGIPMWNPWFASGQPFAANPEFQFFHPLTWLFVVFPFEWAFRLQVVLPILASGVGMAFLLATLGRSRAATLFGALSWTYGGYVLSAANLLPNLFGLAAAPLFLALLVRTARRPSLAAIGGIGLAVGWMLLSGEVMVLAVGLAAPVALLHGFLDRGALGARPRPAFAPGRLLAGLAAAALLGLTIGAGTLLPGGQLFRKTVRAEGVPAEIALSWSLEPVRLFELAVPQLLGHVRTPANEDYWGLQRYAGEGGPFLYSIYPGLLAVAAAAAAWGRRLRVEHGWAALAAVGYLLATGRHGFLWPLAREAVPLLAGFRYPEKLVLLLVLGVTVSASAGFDLLLRRRRTASRVAASVLGVAALAGAAMASSALDLPSLFLGASAAGNASMSRLAKLDGLALLATAVSGLVALRLLVRGRRRAGTALLTLVMGLDVTLHGQALLRSEPAAQVAARPSWVTKILNRNDPDGRVFHLANWSFPRGIYSGFFSPPPMPAYWGLKLTLEGDFDMTELVWSRRATAAAKAAVMKDDKLFDPILERRGVTAVIRLHRAVRLTETGVLHPADLDSPLDVDLSIENARLAFLAEEVRIAGDEEGWARELRDLGMRAGRAAIVDAAGPALPTPPGRGEIVRYATRPGRIEADLRCDGPQPCFLALTDTWDEHWAATVDGRAASIRRSDLSLMGLPVATGSHSVVLTYDDPSVRLAALLTLAGAFVALGLVATGWRRRTARMRPPVAAPDAGAPSPPAAAPRPVRGAKAARRRPKR